MRFVLLLLPSLAFGQSLNHDVTQANIHTTICVPGWTKTVRPSVAYTNGVKRAKLLMIGRKPSDAPHYELDHAIPLALGGHPTSSENLHLQPWAGPRGARAKDVVEARMHRYVCAGKVDLLTAQLCMADDWQGCPK